MVGEQVVHEQRRRGTEDDLVDPSRLGRGERGPRASLDEALDYTRTDEFAARKPSNEQLVYAGRPDDVAARLDTLAVDCAADELVVISPLGEQEPRLTSFGLLAASLGLTARQE